jgi:preprotein translocase subunit SecE
VREKTKNRGTERAAKPAARDAGRSAGRPSVSSPFKAGGGRVGVVGRTQRFVRETKSELKTVLWPTRPEAVRLTMIVIAVSIVIGIFLGTVDYVFKLLFESLVAGF